MKKSIKTALTILVAVSTLYVSCATSSGFEKKLDVNAKTVEFSAVDGITITADIYKPYESDAPFIILCHRADWSRGEYKDIAPILCGMGFNVMAIDQRSGGGVNGIKNITHVNAINEHKKTDYASAMQDIQAAIDYAKDGLSSGKLLLWGSSYSTGLCAAAVNVNAGKIDGLLIFSPGEYYADCGLASNFFATQLKEITVSIFATSSKYEHSSTARLCTAAINTNVTCFCPKENGEHGSAILYKKCTASKETWNATAKYLKQFTK